MVSEVVANPQPLRAPGIEPGDVLAKEVTEPYATANFSGRDQATSELFVRWPFGPAFVIQNEVSEIYATPNFSGREQVVTELFSKRSIRNVRHCQF